MTDNGFKSTRRSAIAATLAASLALTPLTATPVYAGDDDAVGAIAAASIFALITMGLIASSANKARGPDHHGPGFGGPRGGNGPNNGPAKGPHRPHADPRKQLPAQCAFTVRHGPDRGTYYGSVCLKRNFDHWAYLPDRCEERVDLRGQRDRNAYDASCLARFGYRNWRNPPSAHR